MQCPPVVTESESAVDSGGAPAVDPVAPAAASMITSTIFSVLGNTNTVFLESIAIIYSLIFS